MRARSGIYVARAAVKLPGVPTKAFLAAIDNLPSRLEIAAQDAGMPDEARVMRRKDLWD